MSQKTISFYTCECGKKFSGEYNKNKMMIKLHHKRCDKTPAAETPPVVVNFDVLNPKSHIRVDGITDNGVANNDARLRKEVGKVAGSLLGVI
jgi:hypothetical protein